MKKQKNPKKKKPENQPESDRVKLGEVFVPGEDSSDFKLDVEKLWKYLGQKPQDKKKEEVSPDREVRSKILNKMKENFSGCGRCGKKENLLSNGYCKRCDTLLFGGVK